MKKCLLFFTIFLSLHGQIVQNDTSAPNLEGQLISYIKAKWVAHKLKGRFFLTKFAGCEAFDFGVSEPVIPREWAPHIRFFSLNRGSIDWVTDANKMKRIVATRRNLKVGLNTQLNSSSDIHTWDLLKKDEDFKKSIQSKLRIKKKFDFASLPKDVVSVALCVRYGQKAQTCRLSPQFIEGNRMGEEAFQGKRVHYDVNEPLEFVPLQFYLDQIQSLSEEIKKPLYVKVFTDASDPNQIAEAFRERISNKEITIDCVSTKSFSKRNFIKEVADIQRFDYLVHSKFSFPDIVSLLNNFKKVICPTEVKWEDGFLHVVSTTN